MRKLFTVIIFILSVINIYGQDVKTGEGQSSILLETTNVGFDIGETSLSFTTNNFPQSKLRSNGSIWGLFAKGINDEGLAGIFSTSQIVPSSEISAIYGYSLSNSREISDSYAYSQKALSDNIELLTALLPDSLERKVIDMVSKIENEEAQKYIRDAVNSALQSDFLKYDKLEKSLKKIAENDFLKKTISTEAKSIYQFVKENKTWSDIKKMSAKISNNIDKVDTNPYWKFSIYGHFGLNSTKFNVFKGWDSLNIENSFEKNTFRGSNGGFGINLNLKSKWLFGFRYTYEETNNLSMLSTNDYKVTTNYISGSSTGSSQISKTAYPDEYTVAYLNKYDFDIIRFFPLQETSIILSDLYLRIRESTNQSKMVSQKDLGLSASFFKEKGKFIGGIYLELPDLEQNIEKQKPVAEQEMDVWYKRLSFGVYAKFSFSSIINQF
jgi:hypothetical protein